MSDDRWLVDVLDRATRALDRRGVRHWELAADVVHEVGAEAMDGVLSVVERSAERAIGIRVLDGGIGFAGRTEPTDADLDEAIDAALYEASRARPAAITRFAAPEDLGKPFLDPAGFVDPRATATVRADLGERALALEARALGHELIARVRPARVDEERGLSRIRTSSGLDVLEAHSRASASVGVIAEDDEDTQSSYAFTSGPALEALGLEGIADEAATDARALLGAGAFRTARVPVIFGFEAAAELLNLLAGALEADRIERGASFLTGKLGQRVVSPALTILDDPHDPALDGCVVYDAEGLTTSPKRLFDAGVVARYVEDRDAAARAGRPGEGQAVRAGATGRPRPGTHSLRVLGGSVPLAELFRRAEGGLYVHEVSGTHTMNEVTGELSLGATGWALRGGERAEPIQGATVAGTLLVMLSGAITLSSEVRGLGAFGVPAILMEGVQVSA